MEILEKLTPTETYLVRDNSGSTFKELLKLTLADLCLKKVLKIEDKEVQSHPRSPVRVLKYVLTGKNFNNYKPKPHELAFLSPFQKNSEIEVLFNHTIKMAYENVKNRKRYVYKSILLNPELTERFHKDFFTKLIGGISLNNAGESAKIKVDQELRKLESELPQIIQNDKKRALEILNRIGGNVFLISGLDFELLREIDEELTKALERGVDNYGYGCGGCYTSYGDNSDSFDGAFDSADSSGGCGGCGGCS